MSAAYVTTTIAPALLPAKITTDFLAADPGNVSAVREAFDTVSGYAVPYATLRAVLEAIRDGGAVVAMYHDGKCETTARCLFPYSLSLTKNGDIVVTAYCTLRCTVRTFRLDRFAQCHPLTLPADATA